MGIGLELCVGLEDKMKVDDGIARMGVKRGLVGKEGLAVKEYRGLGSRVPKKRTKDGRY